MSKILAILFNGVKSTSKSFSLDKIDWLKIGRQMLMYAIAATSVGWAEKQFHPLLWKIGLGVAIIEIGRRFFADNTPGK